MNRVEAIAVFEEIKASFEALKNEDLVSKTQDDMTSIKTKDLIDRTSHAIRVTFGEDSIHYRQFKLLKFQYSSKYPHVFDSDKVKTIGILTRILDELRINSE